ncbi:MAG: hypothetical protein ACP5K1_00650 [Candidatus Bathyarchaeia archaeon]
MKMIPIEKITSLLLLSLVGFMIAYPALPIGRVSVEVEVEPLKEIALMELRLGELSIHHYGARENNGRFMLVKDAAVKASSSNPEIHRYEARIPYGSYDEIRIEFSEAKAYRDGEPLQLDVSRDVLEENLTLTLWGEAQLKIKLHMNEEEILANHTLYVDVEVIGLR